MVLRGTNVNIPIAPTQPLVPEIWSNIASKFIKKSLNMSHHHKINIYFVQIKFSVMICVVLKT